MYDYLENVKNDVRDFLEENPPCIHDLVDFIECEKIDNKGNCKYYFEDLCDLKEELNDTLSTDDNVTGNGSGSYTFNREEAKEYVLSGGTDLLRNAIEEGLLTSDDFVKYFTNEDWETLDVIIRCYLLYACIDEAVDEWADCYAENNQERLARLYKENENC